jgi:hypothetical protein
VDRIWNIRTDGSGRRLVHARKIEMEIAGHEFWSPDGKTVWYDLQTPKSLEFWLAGVAVAGEQAVRYRVAREDWSVHFNVSPDGRRFAGDGGGSSRRPWPAWRRRGWWTSRSTITSSSPTSPSRRTASGSSSVPTCTDDRTSMPSRSRAHGRLRSRS